MVSNGHVQISSLRVRVRPSNFKESTGQCFRCYRFGHKPQRRPLIATSAYSCLRCSENHNYKKCKADPSQYRRTLCGNHAAVSTWNNRKKSIRHQPTPTQLTSSTRLRSKPVNHELSIWKYKLLCEHATQSRPYQPPTFRHVRDPQREHWKLLRHKKKYQWKKVLFLKNFTVTTSLKVWIPKWWIKASIHKS